MIAGGATATLIAVGQREVVPASGVYTGEQIEVRSYRIYGPPIIDDMENPLVTRLKRISWQFANPGNARLFAAAVRVDKRGPAPGRFEQRVFEELGYKFPGGCFAECLGNQIFLAHYPSMLDNMEKRLGLRSSQKEVPEQAKATSRTKGLSQ